MSNEQIKAIREDIEYQIINDPRAAPRDGASWAKKEGVVISANNATTLLDHIDKLESKIDDAKARLGELHAHNDFFFNSEPKEVAGHIVKIFEALNKQE